MEKKTRRAKSANMFRRVFTVKDNMMSYEDIEKMMYDNTRLSGSNMCILMLAIFIASIGLNTNSTAVIIGAMLVSPLMGNIMSFGYSVAVEDLFLLSKSLIGFLIQVAISLITSSVYFAVSPLSVATSELLARTSPTIWDVMIAICGGLAGMIGSTRREKSNVIPGVAIATALMPPLCTAGYGIGTAQPRYIIGALYLFIINALFIAISTGLITLALGVPHKHENTARKERNLHIKVSAIVIVVVIPSLMAAVSTVQNSLIENRISQFVEAEVDDKETQVVKTSYNIREKDITLVLIGRHVTDSDKEDLNRCLKEYKLTDYTLHIIQDE